MLEDERQFPSEEQILGIYSQIEETATGVINSGNAIGNPLLAEGTPKDRRYAISVDSYVDPKSQIGTYLAAVTNEIAVADEGFTPNHPAELHMTFSEIAHSDTARTEVVRSGADIAQYYKALVENFPSLDNLRCRFVKIMPTPDAAPDPEHPERRPISIVAAFLPDDEELFRLRSYFSESLRSAGLPAGDFGIPRVFFITLGRFKENPKENGQPFLEAIARANENQGEDLTFEMQDMEVISTAARYVFSSGHLYLSPPIPFDKDKRTTGNPKFVRPIVRRNSIA